MSHAATNWALKQRGLKPATKIVLLCLADCHNPHNGCFPSQAKLADDAEMSERAVRTHLEVLENAGLIRRQEGGRRGGTFASTRYILAFEDDDYQRQNLPTEEKTDGKSDRRKTAPPAAESAGHQRQNLPTNPVREPRNGTEAADGRARASASEVIDRITHALGLDRNGMVPKYWAGADAAVFVSRWMSELHLTPDEIVSVAQRNHVQHGSPAHGPKILNRHMAEFASAKTAPLTPIEGATNERHRADRAAPRGAHPGRNQQPAGLVGAALRSLAARAD